MHAAYQDNSCQARPAPNTPHFPPPQPSPPHPSHPPPPNLLAPNQNKFYEWTEFLCMLHVTLRSKKHYHSFLRYLHMEGYIYFQFLIRPMPELGSGHLSLYFYYFGINASVGICLWVRVNVIISTCTLLHKSRTNHGYILWVLFAYPRNSVPTQLY